MEQVLEDREATRAKRERGQGAEVGQSWAAWASDYSAGLKRAGKMSGKKGTAVPSPVDLRTCAASAPMSGSLLRVRAQELD